MNTNENKPFPNSSVVMDARMDRTPFHSPQTEVRMRSIMLSSAALALMMLATGVNAATIAQYPFTGNSLLSTDTEPNSTADSFGTGSGITSPAFSTTGNPAPSRAVTTNQLSSSFNSADYWEFAVSAEPGYKLDLTQLTFDVQNAGSAPLPDGRWDVRSSLDSYGSSLATFTATGSFANKSVDLSGPSFQNLLSITFRLYVYDAANTNSGTKSLRTDNVTLEGNVNLIPEPASVALLAAGVGMIAFRGRGADGR